MYYMKIRQYASEGDLPEDDKHYVEELGFNSSWWWFDSEHELFIKPVGENFIVHYPTNIDRIYWVADLEVIRDTNGSVWCSGEEMDKKIS